MAKKIIRPILKQKFNYKINGSLWIECEGERFFGPGRVELLQRIEKTGSINKAAAEMNMSYKKAWEMINALNTQAGKLLVVTKSGGEKGGGSLITEEAKQLIEYHAQLRKRFQEFLQKESKSFTIA
jgi:molybdate transport system regulatory protein